MTTIRFHDATWAILDTEDIEAVQYASRFLTAESPGAKYSIAYKSGRWDGKFRLLRRPSNTFPSGLAIPLHLELRTRGVQCALSLPTPPKPVPLPGASENLIGVEDRVYQDTAVAHTMLYHRVALECPTGGGKTEIGAEIARRIGGPILWVVHTTSILEQTFRRVKALLGGKVEIRMLGGGNKWDPEELATWVKKGGILVSTIQSLNRLDWEKEDWARFRGLIVDEAHHASAETWIELANLLTGAWYRIGLSGTLTSRGTKRGADALRALRTVGALGPIFKVASTTELVDQGFLAKPEIVMCPVDRRTYPTYPEVRNIVLPDWQRDPRRLGKMGGELFRQAYEMGIMENGARNASVLATAWKHLKEREKVLVLCTRLDHGAHLFHSFTKQAPKVWCRWISGKENLDERREALEGFVQDGAKLLIASTIFQEGIDLPAIDTLICAGGGASEIAQVQRVGRSLRVRKDKNSVLVYDFLDGRYPFEEKDYLAQHTLERLRVYRAQGFDISGLDETMQEFLDGESDGAA